eukprot:TRINITY_DN14385_c0_g1_i1.p1 TRINITY_DN14385_c0_g1~~TRINITY_DN14385_c0_g1_i1.p1  ORF type:complete len:378 (-),score=16.86 TRINITY_DN14385_c0_g1_i1:77-1069(-)
MAAAGGGGAAAADAADNWRDLFPGHDHAGSSRVCMAQGKNTHGASSFLVSRTGLEPDGITVTDQTGAGAAAAAATAAAAGIVSGSGSNSPPIHPPSTPPPLNQHPFSTPAPQGPPTFQSPPGFSHASARDSPWVGMRESSGGRLLTAALQGRSILVVDDNMVNRKVIGRLLQRYGARVEVVEGGRQAIERLQQAWDFDCLFMDIQMPGMDGFQTTMVIRKLERERMDKGGTGEHAKGQPEADDAKSNQPWNDSSSTSAMAPGQDIWRQETESDGGKRNSVLRQNGHTPIFALTADIGAGTRERCKQVGMDGFMTKPIEEDQLCKVVLPYF